jgi:nicotinamidase/pyrazinamidase
VDVQHDFLPGGNLGVPGGDAVVVAMNKYIGKFIAANLPVIATRDFHPEDHVSFKAQGGTWPPHCVAGTIGAAFPHDLRLPQDVIIISKGTATDKDAYSGFEGCIRHQNDLPEYMWDKFSKEEHPSLAAVLKTLEINRVFIGGLATDYCVKATVLDGCNTNWGASENKRVYYLADASAAVNINEGDKEKAEKEMEEAGAITVVLEIIE